jgi:hypothetical protein
VRHLSWRHHWLGRAAHPGGHGSPCFPPFAPFPSFRTPISPLIKTPRPKAEKIS